MPTEVVHALLPIGQLSPKIVDAPSSAPLCNLLVEKVADHLGDCPMLRSFLAAVAPRFSAPRALPKDQTLPTPGVSPYKGAAPLPAPRSASGSSADAR